MEIIQIKNLFIFTNNENDKLHVKDLRIIFSKNKINIDARVSKELFIDWGAKYYDNATKININGVFRVGYSGIKIK